jgi:hypothetical protein
MAVASRAPSACAEPPAKTHHGVGHGVQGEVEGLQARVYTEGLRSDPALLYIITQLDPKAKK